MGHDGPWAMFNNVQQLCSYVTREFSSAPRKTLFRGQDTCSSTVTTGRCRLGVAAVDTGSAALPGERCSSERRSLSSSGQRWAAGDDDFTLKLLEKNGFHQQNWWNQLDLTNRHVDPKEMTKQVGFKRQYVGINADLSWFKHANCCIIGTKCDRVGGLQCFSWCGTVSPMISNPQNLTENAWCTQSPTAP